ncbi:MAG: hypothetical protein VX335_00375 [Pseudomonadota bacterium]|nr:hypothetical protein [Pseudomonadota bacterium]
MGQTNSPTCLICFENITSDAYLPDTTVRTEKTWPSKESKDLSKGILITTIITYSLLMLAYFIKSAFSANSLMGILSLFNLEFALLLTLTFVVIFFLTQFLAKLILPSHTKINFTNGYTLCEPCAVENYVKKLPCPCPCGTSFRDENNKDRIKTMYKFFVVPTDKIDGVNPSLIVNSTRTVP